MSADFIDSNVFVYLFDEVDERKRKLAEKLINRALETRHACISFQVVQETLNVITGKLATPATPQDSRRFLDRILARPIRNSVGVKVNVSARRRHHPLFEIDLDISKAQ